MAEGLRPYARCYVIYRDQTDFTEGERVKIPTIRRWAAAATETAGAAAG
jgi:hypothetical protein